VIETTIDLPVSIEQDGEEWRLFVCDYQHDGQTFTFYMYARSHEDAESRMESLGSTGEVAGMMSGWVDGRTPEATVRTIAETLQAAATNNTAAEIAN